MQNKFKAIMLIGEVKKYFSIAIAYFNSIAKKDVQKIVNESSGSENGSLLAQAAMCSKHWSWNDISQQMERLKYSEEACHTIINSKRLSGQQMISILNLRVTTVGLVSIGPLISAAIRTEKLKGPELITVLNIYTNPSITDEAKPQLEKYIESAEEEPPLS